VYTKWALKLNKKNTQNEIWNGRNKQKGGMIVLAEMYDSYKTNENIKWNLS
jgi:hypothetical protein